VASVRENTQQSLERCWLTWLLFAADDPFRELLWSDAVDER
jgi:hypothetical protein